MPTAHRCGLFRTGFSDDSDESELSVVSGALASASLSSWIAANPDLVPAYNINAWLEDRMVERGAVFQQRSADATRVFNRLEESNSWQRLSD